MSDEKVINLTEFKVVMEGVDSKLRKIIEVMDHRFEVLQEQVGLLHEGQTEIKAELRAGLKDKVADHDFAKLEKRVARLERKTA
jgi:hypothetical protein